ncbi:hypothetical protein [Vibrio sp. Hal054]|uniref:hypothetical protein n=1 Tax=Vibrio sp. Hal054 TaxID=3035158 RepID=UPI00301E0BCC
MSGDKKRVIFDVTVTLTYLGFYDDSAHSYASALEAVPAQYLPCDLELADSFHLSNMSISRIVKYYTPVLLSGIKIANADVNYLKNIKSRLPLTMDSINSELISYGVIKSNISFRCLLFLFDIIFSCKHAIDSSVIFLSSKDFDEDGNRYERNTRPSFKVIHESRHAKDVKLISSAIVRNSESVGKVLGFISFELVYKLLLILNEASVKNVFSDPDVAKDFTYSICSIKFPNRFGDFCVYDELKSTDFYEFLYQYLSVVRVMPKSRIIDFTYRILKYRTHASRSSSKVALKMSSPLIGRVIEEVRIPDSVFYNVVDSVDFTLTDADAVAINDEIFVDVEGCKSIAYFIVLDYLKINGNEFFNMSESERIEAVKLHYASVMEEKLHNALDNPDGFFDVVNGVYKVNSSHVKHKENHIGHYKRPHYDYITDEIYTENALYDDEITNSNAAFDLHFKLYSKISNMTSDSWSDVMVDDSHELYSDLMEMRRKLILETSYDAARRWLNSELKRAKANSSSCQRYLDYLLLAKDNDAYAETLTRTQARLDKWMTIVDIISNDIELLTTSPSYISKINHQNRILELSEQRERLSILPSTYKAHILLHDFISLNASVSRADMEAFVTSYCTALRGTFDEGMDVGGRTDYYNILAMFSMCIKYHPFGAQ